MGCCGCARYDLEKMPPMPHSATAEELDAFVMELFQDHFQLMHDARVFPDGKFHYQGLNQISEQEALAFVCSDR